MPFIIYAFQHSPLCGPKNGLSFFDQTSHFWVRILYIAGKGQLPGFQFGRMGLPNVLNLGNKVPLNKFSKICYRHLRITKILRGFYPPILPSRRAPFYRQTKHKKGKKYSNIFKKELFLSIQEFRKKPIAYFSSLKYTYRRPNKFKHPISKVLQ